MRKRLDPLSIYTSTSKQFDLLLIISSVHLPAEFQESGLSVFKFLNINLRFFLIIFKLSVIFSTVFTLKQLSFCCLNSTEYGLKLSLHGESQSWRACSFVWLGSFTPPPYSVCDPTRASSPPHKFLVRKISPITYSSHFQVIQFWLILEFVHYNLIWGFFFFPPLC